MVNHTQDFVAVKKYEILQYSLIPTDLASVTTSSPISRLSDDDMTLMTDDLLLTEAEEGAS